MASTFQGGLFEPGRNCFQVGEARRVSLIVDGEAYFRAFAQAALAATRSIVIVGWDFHSRTCLHHGIPGVPEHLGDFLNFLVERERRLHVRVLIWDYPMIFSKGRELSPIYGFGWRPRHRVRVRYDDHYPIGASQHQKLVVIDGMLAFCGGIDLTRSRWDGRAHRPGEERRINEGETTPYAPFHDTVMAMDGRAAHMLDDVVRERWQRATGKRIPARERHDNLLRRAATSMRASLRMPPRRVATRRDPWPEDLTVDLSNVKVAVARTVAPMGDEPPIREVEALYLDLIKAARRIIYIENQYFTSYTLGEALAARLREPDGPEVIAVLRLSTAGWLEAPTMGTLRTVLLRKLRDADVHGRFHAYYPYIPGLPDEQHCDLHSKLLIADESALLIGSANFCNRSMGLDTECSTAIEAGADERIGAGIRDFRNGLLAEHLTVESATVVAAIRQHGSVARAIAALQGDARTLKLYEHLEEPSQAMVAFASNVDPEQPVGLEELVAQFAPEEGDSGRRSLYRLGVSTVLVLVLLAALWRYTPLKSWTDTDQIVQWASLFADQIWAPLAVVAVYTPACIVLFPRPLITLFAVVAFGAAWGFIYAFCGILLAALVTYALGRRLERSEVRRIAGSRLNRLSRVMREQGVLAMTAVRLVPLAPFSVVNAVAGAIRFPLRSFILGSAIGMLPGTLVATVFGEQLAEALRNPRDINVPLIVIPALVLGATTLWMRRGFVRHR